MTSKQELQVQQKRELETKEEVTVPARIFLPTADIFEDEDALHVVLEMPGVEKDNINVSVREGVLNIDGHLDFSKYKDLQPLYTEYNVGNYSRSFRLSSTIDQSKIGAELRDGVLDLAEGRGGEATDHPDQIRGKCGMSIIRRLLGCFAVCCALVSAAPAQNARVPSSPGEIKLSFAPAVKRVTPAVVNVYAARIVENRVPLFDDPVFRRFFGGSNGPREQVQRSLGSGVVVDASGLVVTNNHVIENADQIKVALADKREFDAVLVLKDERSDLAVLRITDGRERFTAVDFGDSDALEVGDVVLAVGNPFGIGQTVTHGIVSAVARTQVGITDYQFFIQTDAAINPGNSGGALVDIGGKLVGINTAIFSRSGGSQGIGFAIPANMVRAVVASAKAGAASVRRPWLGAKLQPVTPEIAESLSLKRPVGALVNTISPRSPAARSGLRIGDLIIEVDGQAIDDPNAFDYRFATKPLGGQAQVAVMRGGREVKIGIPLEMAPETPREETVIKVRSPLLGARVANLSPALAEELRLDYRTEGVVVTDVENGSASQSFGFQKGDIVVSVNNAKIAIMEDLLRAISQPVRLWRLTILRGGQEISAVFGG